VRVQQLHERLQDYIVWVQSCRVLVTCESLGMHVALALRKRVVVLFGSTSWAEIELYGRGIKLVAQARCAPCYKARCPQPFYCMDWIDPRVVEAAIERASSTRLPLDETWIVPEPPSVRALPLPDPPFAVPRADRANPPAP
jgi:ADP-heptose:LPS heptosyltransferase